MRISELIQMTDNMRTWRKEKLMMVAAIRHAAETHYNWHEFDGEFLKEIKKEERNAERNKSISSRKSIARAHILNSLPHWFLGDPDFVTCIFQDVFGLLLLPKEPFEPNDIMKSLARVVYSETITITCPHCKKPECILDTGVMNRERLSVLADAVEEVYGTNRVVSHLRCGRSLYRGDWAVDLILGKK